MGAKENWTSRIDHVVHTGGVTVRSPQYVSELGGRSWPDPRRPAAAASER
jgi:hypothetical protein